MEKYLHCNIYEHIILPVIIVLPYLDGIGCKLHYIFRRSNNPNFVPVKVLHKLLEHRSKGNPRPHCAGKRRVIVFVGQCV